MCSEDTSDIRHDNSLDTFVLTLMLMGGFNHMFLVLLARGGVLSSYVKISLNPLADKALLCAMVSKIRLLDEIW